MIMSYDTNQNNHDDAISRGYIHFVKSAYVTYYFDNEIEAQYIAQRVRSKVQTEEKEIIQCSKCKRYKSHDGIWEYKPDFTVIKRDLKNNIIGNISHGLCPECEDDIYDEI